MSLSDLRLSEQEHSELIALLQRLIQFPTEDPPGRELELARFVHDTLAAGGLTSDLIEFQPGRANVIARLKGQGERRGLVFSAHFDTLPAGQGDWQFPPFEGQISTGKVYGRGASDIKSGMAAMIAAALRLAREELPLKGDLILAFSAGESSNLLGARQMVRDGSLQGAGALLVSDLSSTGGSAINMTPDRAELGLDIRYLPGMSAEDILGELQALAGSEITFEILDDKPPVETPTEHPFVRLCRKSCRSVLGKDPPLDGVPYFSDAAILGPALGLPWVIIGPGEIGMTGQRDEYVVVDKVAAAANIYMQIALDFLLN